MAKKEDQSPVGGAPEKAHPNDLELFILALYELLARALDSKNPASKPAGELLAYVDALIAAKREKLCEANEVYKRKRQRLGKLLRQDVWFPKSSLYMALHRELWHCWFYRRELPDPLLFQPKWRLEEYRSLMKLPKLSLKSLPQWEPELWQLVKKHNPQLPSELQRKYKRVEARWSKYRKEFHQHLHTIVAAQSRGILPG